MSLRMMLSHVVLSRCSGAVAVRRNLLLRAASHVTWCLHFQVPAAAVGDWKIMSQVGAAKVLSGNEASRYYEFLMQT
jgi:hypothetical protein